MYPVLFHPDNTKSHGIVSSNSYVLFWPKYTCYKKKVSWSNTNTKGDLCAFQLVFFFQSTFLYKQNSGRQVNTFYLIKPSLFDLCADLRPKKILPKQVKVLLLVDKSWIRPLYLFRPREQYRAPSVQNGNPGKTTTTRFCIPISIKQM